jgi:hypothetical protein
MKGRWLWFVGNFLIWGVPLIYILAVAVSITNAETTSTEGGQQLVFNTWFLVILIGLMFIYIANIRKAMKEALFVAQIKDGIVPPLWRFVQFAEYGISTGILMVVIYAISRLANPLFTFLLVSLFSGSIGYLFLILDSVGRTRELDLQRKSLAPSIQKSIMEAVEKGLKKNETK